MGIGCPLFGHRWIAGACTRCGKKCGHTHVEQIDSCRVRCTECGMIISHHAWEPTDEPGRKKCSVCGATDYNPRIAEEWKRKQKEKLDREQRRQEADMRFQRFLQAHRAREKERLYAEEQFLCHCCDRVLPVSKQYRFYGGILCQECAKTLKYDNGHYVFERLDGRRELTRTCVKCWQNEWMDEEGHFGGSLKEKPCIEG